MNTPDATPRPARRPTQHRDPRQYAGAKRWIRSALACGWKPSELAAIIDEAERGGAE